MRFAFAIFTYFPYGGLQLDMLRAAKAAVRRGHEVTLFTMSCKGELPEGVKLEIIPGRGLSNATQAAHFAEDFHRVLQTRSFDRTLAWNRITDCDFYFCADTCLMKEYLKKYPPLLLKLHPRYRTFLRIEREILQRDSRTICMYISPEQKTDYQHFYQTQDERLILLPPGINETVRQTPDDPSIRAALRSKLGLDDETIMLVQAGFSTTRKGSDLLLRAAAALPEEWRKRNRIFFLGPTDPAKCRGLARHLGIAENAIFPGPQKNIADWLKASDLMVHPARNESAGSVLLESLACGTPVLCSGECGFSNFVRDSGGLSTQVPTKQDELNFLLLKALQNLPEMRKSVREYAEHCDFYSRADKIIDILEK